MDSLESLVQSRRDEAAMLAAEDQQEALDQGAASPQTAEALLNLQVSGLWDALIEIARAIDERLPPRP